MMNKIDLPVYQITIDDFDEAGIDLISFVSNPAIIIKGLAFAEQEHTIVTELKFNEDQQIVAGAVLIPDMKIYRYDEEIGEYFVTFSKETIRKMVEKLKQNQKKDLFNIDHTDTLAPAYLLGSWIIESTEFDKSRMYGFDELPIGTFFCEVKVTDKAFWEKEVKSNGKFGFSIEGMMGLKLSQMIKEKNNINIELEKVSFDVDGVLTTSEGRDKFKEAINNSDDVYIISARNTKDSIENLLKEYDLTLDSSKIFALGSNDKKIEKINELDIKKHYDDNPNVINQIKEVGIKFTIINNKNKNMKRKFKFMDYITKDNIKISIDGELAVGSSVFIVSEDGTMNEAEAGDIVLEDGTLLVIDETGVITEIKAVEVTEDEIVAEADVKEEVKMQVSEEEIMVIVNPILDEMRKIIAEMQSRIEMLEGNMPVEDEMSKTDNLSFSDEMKFKFNNLRRILD